MEVQPQNNNMAYAGIALFVLLVIVSITLWFFRCKLFGYDCVSQSPSPSTVAGSPSPSPSTAAGSPSPSPSTAAGSTGGSP